MGIIKFEETEQVLGESQRFLRATLDSLPTHIAILDEAGTIIYVNAAWCRFAEANDLNQLDCGLGMNYLDVCERAGSDDDAQALLVAQRIREIITHQRQGYSLEYACHSPLEQRWFNMTITPFKDEGPVRIVVSHENITERKQVEIALLRSIEASETACQQSVIYARELGTEIATRKHAEESLRLSQAQLLVLIEQAPHTIAMFDLDMRYLVTSRRWVDEYGRGYPDLIGRHHYEVHPDLPDWWKAVHQRGLAGETLAKDEDLWVQADGSKHWLRWTVLPWRNAQGEIGGIIISAEDITARKRAEAQFRLVVEAAPHAIILVGQDSTIRLVNTWTEAVFGYSREELLGQAIEMLVPGSFRAQHRRDRETFLSAPITRPMGVGRDLFGLRKDGRQVPLEIGLTPIDTPEGTLVLASVIDITERKQAEQQLADYTAQLQALTQRLVETQEAERRSIARELHDEVGQVMLAVKTNLETIHLAPDPATLNQQLAESVNIVSQALEQIRTLSLNLRPSLLDDFGLIPTLEWYVDRQAKSAPFQLSFHTNAPEMRLPPVIETNCFRVVQAALTNIVRHAQASRVKVTLNLIPDSQELELSVLDDGLGFNVTAALKRARHGQSLGLLGMQERIQLIGGQIAIQSRPGRGTEIRVRVPIPTKVEAKGDLDETTPGFTGR